MRTIAQLLNTYPGAIILILSGILFFRYNIRDARKRKLNKEEDLFSVGVRGFGISIMLIFGGTIILYLLLFTDKI